MFLLQQLNEDELLNFQTRKGQLYACVINMENTTYCHGLISEVFASDLYGYLQRLAWGAVLNAHKGRPLTFYLFLVNGHLPIASMPHFGKTS